MPRSVPRARQAAAGGERLHQRHAALEAHLPGPLHLAVDVEGRRPVDVDDVAVLDLHVELGATGLEDRRQVDVELDRLAVASADQGDDVGAARHHAAGRGDHLRDLAAGRSRSGSGRAGRPGRAPRPACSGSAPAGSSPAVGGRSRPRAASSRSAAPPPGSVRPPTVTAPISGKLICPASEMRASTAEVGVLEDGDARTTSPTPEDSCSSPRLVSPRARPAAPGPAPAAPPARTAARTSGNTACGPQCESNPAATRITAPPGSAIVPVTATGLPAHRPYFIPLRPLSSMSPLGIDAGAASRGATSICGAASTPEAGERGDRQSPAARRRAASAAAAACCAA